MNNYQTSTGPSELFAQPDPYGVVMTGVGAT